MKGFFQHALKRAGYTLSKAPELIDFLLAREIDVVYDVGANVGQFATKLRALGYSGNIVSFEPVARVYEQLERRMRGDKKWIGHNLALGARSSREVINVSEATVFSSILSQNECATRYYPKARVDRTESIDVRSFDDMFEGRVGRRAFLKIDTQGFERQVLEGAKRSLTQFHGLQLELPIEHLYDDEWNLPSALAFMANAGFVPAQMHPTNYITGDPQCWTEVDCIFKRVHAA